MVESVGSSTIKASTILAASVQRAKAPQPVAEVSSPAKSEASTAQAATQAPGALASAMAAKPPVDTNRVQQIKTALANGTFPLSPSTIADQFIALKYDWMANNESA